MRRTDEEEAGDEKEENCLKYFHNCLTKSKLN